MERDDIIEYSLHAHHSEEDGKKIRKDIYKVTVILSVITAIEVLVGVKWKVWFSASATAWTFIKFGYIILTLVKAAYIILTFMHLGDERKTLKYTILVPYVIFIAYLLFILLAESTYTFDIKEMLNWTN